MKPLLKKKSTIQESAKREHTGRRLSFSDENGGNLAKVSQGVYKVEDGFRMAETVNAEKVEQYYEIQNIATTSSSACIIS